MSSLKDLLLASKVIEEVNRPKRTYKEKEVEAASALLEIGKVLEPLPKRQAKKHRLADYCYQ